MKPSSTINVSLKNLPAIRTDGDINSVLGNTLLAFLRGEISAGDAQTVVALTDGMCNAVNTSVKAMRAKIDMQRAAEKKVQLVELGQQVFNGDHQ